MATFKDFINNLDKDKEKKGLQFFSPQTKQKIMNSRVVKNLNPNTYSPGFTKRLGQRLDVSKQAQQMADYGIPGMRASYNQTIKNP